MVRGGDAGVRPRSRRGPEPAAPEARRPAWFGPWVLVALSVAWGLWELRPELRAVPYLDDSSLHEQMVRAAAARISQGHLPLTSWFPYLGLGSPQFLHYQSLPSMLSGVIGTAVDPDTVFRWSLYLLLALWPLAVYWSGRLFGLSRWTAASAAAVAPFLASAAGIGYETKAYVWVGYGVWTQLWASWTLPLAWGFTYRALSSLRGAFFAVLFIMLTVALHYETGYLAFVPLVVWPFIVPSDLWRRLGRAVALGAAALLASAWVIVPLLQQSHWAARNQVLEGTGLENGYGAGQMLSWLVHRPPLRRRPLARRHRPRRPWASDSASGAGARSRPAVPSCSSGWSRSSCRSGGRPSGPSTTFCRAAATSSSGASRWACSSRASCWPASASCSSDGSRWRRRSRLFPEERRGWVSRPAGRGIVAGLCIVALIVVLAPGLEQHGHLRRATTRRTSASRPRPTRSRSRRSTGCWPTCAPIPRAASTPARRPTGARTSSWGRSPCSSISRARTSTRSGTRCARRRS